MLLLYSCPFLCVLDETCSIRIAPVYPLSRQTRFSVWRMRRAATTALVSLAWSMAACGGGQVLVVAQAACTPWSLTVSAANYVHAT